MNSENDIFNSLKDKYDNKEKKQKSSFVGVIVGTALTIFLCVLMMVLEYINSHSIDFGKPSIVASICSLASLIDGFNNVRIKEIILGIICSIIGIICFYIYLSRNLGIL